MKRESLIFHIDGDAFFASIEQSYHPALRGRPVIVGGLANQRGVVHTASYEARKRGIRTGMALMTAKDICPEAIFLKGNFQHYQAISRQLQDIYLRFTPIVEFTSQDDAYVDLSGTSRLYRSPMDAALALWTSVWREIGISISIGIGSSKLIARLASEVLKPGGIFDVPPEAESAFLAPLPVEALPGIGRVNRSKLHDLGIRTVGQLRRLPGLVLAEIFGVNGQKFHDLALGIDRRTVKRRILPGSISRETTFEEDVTDIGLIEATLQYLAERIGAKLREKEITARQVGIRIRYSDFKQYETQLTLTEATDDAIALQRAARELLGRHQQRRIRVRLVGIRVAQIDWADHQADLFAGPTIRGDVNRAVDSIRDKFGFTSILPATALELNRKYRLEKSGFVLHSPALTE